MKISVLISSGGVPAKLSRCLDALAAQSLPSDRFEVLVSGECDGVAPDACRRIATSGKSLGADRNLLIRAARNELLIFLAADVIPNPDLLERHAQSHEALAGKPALIVGAAPDVIRLPDRLLDRVARETALTSSLAQMERHSASVERDWTFRHANLRNFSFRSRNAIR